MAVNLSLWVNEELSKILDFPVPEDLTRYILSIENSRDLEEYLKTLLNFQNPSHRQFLSEILKKCARQNFSGKGNKTSEVEEKYIINKQNDKKGNKTPPMEPASKKSEQMGKKKSKYVGLYTQEGQNKDVVLLKGRHKCFCQASKHELINNCLCCGRIVCEQEGPGPCLFCGNLVYPSSMDLADVLEAHQEYSKSTRQDSVEWSKAIEQRNRLLNYDRSSERRTKVIDDENDYFSLNSTWLSKEEREQLLEREKELKQKRDDARSKKKITFDFSGRKLIEEEGFSDVYDPDDPVLKAIKKSVSTNEKTFQSDGDNIPCMMFPQPKFQESLSKKSGLMNSNSGPVGVQRVQDQGLMEMSDQGLCLSLHQPWASLLVHGIMKDEGRSWYTPHRGRLWVAAAAKVPALEDIKEAEQFFRIIENDDNLSFPSQYPISCLLGYVDVLDCLSQEDYQLQYPQGRSQSPYVLVCNNPHHLPVYFPVQGKHKIYKLDSKIHQAAQKALQRVAKLQAEKMTKEFI